MLNRPTLTRILSLLVTLTWWCIAAPAPASPQDMVTYVGGPRGQHFVAVTQLSDGTILVGGGSDNLDWVPADVPRVVLDGSAVSSARTGQVGFLAQFSADMQKLLRVVYLPVDVAVDIRAIRTTNVPGQPTGDMYIAGPRVNGDPEKDGGATGYFIARLNGNFVDRAPTALEWVRNVAAVGTYVVSPAWDVTSDGRVYFAAGEPFSKSWGAIYRINAQNAYDPVEHWRFHLTGTGAWYGTPASSRSDVKYSAISLRLSDRGSLRSWTREDYILRTPDGNGGEKQGLWPLDLFFAGPFNAEKPDESPGGAGYTGYALGPAGTAEVGALVVDRRNNHLYFGLSVQSRLPDGRFDVEPAVVAMTGQGRLKWWSRLYTETPENSRAHQFVDALAIDYARPADDGALVVAARTLGKEKHNLWGGDQVKAPGAPPRTVQSGFDGQADNFFISWLGRLATESGALLNATYVGEYAATMRITGPTNLYQDPNLDAWLDHDKGLADLAETRLGSNLAVDAQGRIYVLGRGRRVVTTANAFQKMLKPEQGLSVWCRFVRVYPADFSTFTYSSILTGEWNKNDGRGGDNTAITGVIPVPGGLIAVGQHLVDRDRILIGNAIPTRNVPPWGRTEPAGQEAIVAKLNF
ncbi:MAG: hypothetical protein WD042_15670 [Phycisphaeraceae bacterium]